MKAYLIQPFFCDDMADADKCFLDLLSEMDECKEDADIIVLPEYSDVPVNTKTDEEFFECIEKYNEKVLKKAKETAVRCNSLVFINAALKTDKGYRNTTFAINQKGEVVGKYYKFHLAPSEFNSPGMDYSYKKEKYEPTIIEIDGFKYGFLTCYDFYFFEDFVELARAKPDIIIGCSHQRTDTHEALSIIGKFLAYNTNAYLLRSSISLGEDKDVCGCSMVVSPFGEMLLNMKSRIGVESVEFNPKNKYYKEAGFMGKVKSHFDYVEEGRNFLKK